MPASSVSTELPRASSTIFVGMYVEGWRLVTVTSAGSSRSASSKPVVICASLLCP
jgi:hypothetical protein